MQNNIYLNTEQAATYLGISERKLYELVAKEAIPCSKVTGKWLFPRAALDRWVIAGLVHPPGFAASAPPSIAGGSHDLLLEWAIRRSGSGLALLSEGSEAGLERLARNEIAIAAIHLHQTSDDEHSNELAVSAASGLHDAVVIAFASREQGLLVGKDNPLAIQSLEDAIATGARFGMRQPGAGAQLLLQVLAQRLGAEPARLKASGNIFATGQDLAVAIRAGDIDCGIAPRSAAQANGLGFVSLVWEKYDLVMRQRTYFEKGPQALFSTMRSAEFVRQANVFGGYDVSRAGTVLLNK